VVARQHLANQTKPPFAAGGGSERPPLPVVAREVFLLTDFLADARNLPRMAQRFVNVAAARLAAARNKSGETPLSICP
jgi:hypothetical protein